MNEATDNRIFYKPNTFITPIRVSNPDRGKATTTIFDNVIKMIYREAKTEDIEAYMKVRMSVKENVLNNPALVTYDDNVEYLNVRGKGWVCETENTIVGFAIADLKDHNIWALFVHPEYEGKGIGKRLHDIMLNWYFSQTNETVWLGTAPNTRAEKFYTKSGWTNVGVVNKEEVKFEMSYDDWIHIRKTN